VSRERKKLLELFESLGAEQQETLLAFAEFLLSRREDAGDAALPREPPEIERPAGETVVTAIRRLARTYPMLDRRKLMAEASHFMAQHALEGRPAPEVIGELEQVFSRHYQKMRSAE